jgi:hypothetical protein
MKRNTLVKLFSVAAVVAATTSSCSLFNGSKTNVSDTVNVGAILPMTGSTGYLGEGESLGVKLALADRKPTDTKINFMFEDCRRCKNYWLKMSIFRWLVRLALF